MRQRRVGGEASLLRLAASCWPRLAVACCGWLWPAAAGYGLTPAAAACLLDREVAREADAGVDQHNVQEAKHGGATVLDLHDLEAAHVLRGDQAKRVEDAERRGDTWEHASREV